LKLKTLHKIFGNETGGELQGIVIRHKAGIRFFTGLEKDFDPANTENYPAFAINPVSANTNINADQSGEVIQTWSLQAELVDLLPTDRTPNDYNDLLYRLKNILDEMLFEFVLTFGIENNAGSGVTYDNITENLCFHLSGDISFTPVIDDGENNLTGWVANFTIEESILVNDIVCCLDDVFN